MTTTKKYSLPRDFAEKWVAALRSGEYKQGKEKLGNKDEGYCCLGIGAIIWGATDEMLFKKNTDVPSGFIREGEYGPKIPEAVMDKIPAEIKGGAATNDLVRTVSIMNDDGKSFSQIADWIEQNVAFV